MLSQWDDKPEEASQLRIYYAKTQCRRIFKRKDCNTVLRPGTLTNDSPIETIALEHKLNKHGEISRADVANTSKKAWMIILPRILHLKL
jgi:hypothetical protein